MLMQRQAGQIQAKGFSAIGIAVRVMCLLVGLAMPVLANGQQFSGLLLSFDDDHQAPTPPPTYAISSQQITIDADLIILAETAESIAIQVTPTTVVELEITAREAYINGDRLIRASAREKGEFYSLSLVIGQFDLFGHLSTANGSRQIVAVARENSFEGWLYEPSNLQSRASSLSHDFVIPDHSKFEAIRKHEHSHAPTQAFFNNSGNELPQTAVSASVDGIDASNFEIVQKFSKNPVIVGTSIDATVSFDNLSNEAHQALFVEFYFMLENSELISASPNCRAQLSLSQQRVLHCDLGDFAPGQSKSVTYSLQTSEVSQPVIQSTALVGNLRLDDAINVVRDVVQDSDGDGLSDFNEQLLGTDPLDEVSVDTQTTVIDVLTLYTAGADALYEGGAQTRINQLISVANQVYVDSGVKISLRPVYHGLVDYNDRVDMDSALDDLINKTDSAFANVDRLRNQFGADLVVLFRPLETDASRCGLATLGGFNTNGDFSGLAEREFAYSHIGIDCPIDIVVAHELGHNMGLTHSVIEDGMGGTFSFSTGYGVDGQFATVMASPAAFNTETRVARFSDPHADCIGFSCGVEDNGEFGADAVKSLNIVRHQIANYTETVVPQLPELSVSSLRGAVTNAKFSIAATLDDGLNFVTEVSPGQSVSVLGELVVDSRHIGEYGSLHALVITETQGNLQLNAEGKFESWDGTVAGLAELDGTRRFQGREAIRILDDFSFDESFAGQTLTFYIGYRMPVFFNDIIYTTEPLRLRIIP